MKDTVWVYVPKYNKYATIFYRVSENYCTFKKHILNPMIGFEDAFYNSKITYPSTHNVL